jgi:hypothetical protein
MLRGEQMSEGPIRYPTHIRWFTLLGIGLSLCIGVCFVISWEKYLPPIEQYDMWAYVRTSLLPEFPFWKSYTVAMSGNHSASAEEPLTRLATVNPKPDALRDWLREAVYHRALWRVFLWPLISFAFVLFGLMGLGSRLDRRRNAEARDGQVLRGPQLISKWKWNQAIKPSNRGFWIETR